MTRIKWDIKLKLYMKIRRNSSKYVGKHMNIYINTSDIASYIGQSTWDQITPFERYWRKFEVFVVPEKVKASVPIEKKQYIESTFSTKEEKVEKYLSLDSIKKVTNNKELNIAQQKEQINILVNQVPDISPDNRMQLRKNTQSIINTTFGIVNEATVLKDFEEKTNKTLDKSQKLYSKVLETEMINCDDSEESEDLEIFGEKVSGDPKESQESLVEIKKYIYKNKYTICGRIDGNDVENRRIIEVKNRVNGFFNKLRDYEKTQIHVYMWLLDYTEASLVQKYKGETRNTVVYFDDGYFDGVLKDLCKFIEKFEIFLSMEDKKIEYTLMNTYEKKNFIDTFCMDFF